MTHLSGVPCPVSMKTMSIRLPEHLRVRLVRHAGESYTTHGVLIAAIALGLDVLDEHPEKLMDAYGGLKKARTTPSVPSPAPSTVEDEPGDVPLAPSTPMPVSPPVSFEDEATVEPADVSISLPPSDSALSSKDLGSGGKVSNMDEDELAALLAQDFGHA